MALVGGGLAVGLWQWWAGPQASVAQLPGVGSVSSASFQASAFAAWRAGVDPAALAPHLRLLATTAAIVALIGSMESLLNIAAVEQRIGGRADPDRELVALGVATMVSGAAGGLPVVYMRLRVLAAWDAGARRPLSMALVSVLVALVFLFAAPFIARLPTAVVGGIVVMLAIGLFDRWTRLAVRQWRSGRRDEELTWSLAVAMLVCVVTVVWGFAAGVLSGTALAVWIFMRALDRRLVRSRFTAKEFPSRRLYTAQDELALAPHRPCIRVLELEGALFFGTADRLLDEGERLEPDTKTLIVDLRRVTMIDATGADALSQLSRRLADRGVRLRLSGLRPDDHHDAALRAHGLVLDGVNGPQAHPNVDLAIEAAEHEVLTEAVPGRAASIPLVQCHLFDGLDEHQARLLASHMTERRLEAGERLFAPGDPGDDLYVLTEGSINIVDGNRGHRYVSVSPGMCFGEVALLDRGGRTAGAVADAPSVVHALSAQAFAALLRDEPALAAQVYRNLAIHLSGRLRVAAAAWWHAAG